MMRMTQQRLKPWLVIVLTVLLLLFSALIVKHQSNESEEKNTISRGGGELAALSVEEISSREDQFFFFGTPIINLILSVYDRPATVTSNVRGRFNTILYCAFYLGPMNRCNMCFGYDFCGPTNQICFATPSFPYYDCYDQWTKNSTCTPFRTNKTRNMKRCLWRELTACWPANEPNGYSGWVSECESCCYTYSLLVQCSASFEPVLRYYSSFTSTHLFLESLNSYLGQLVTY